MRWAVCEAKADVTLGELTQLTLDEKLHNFRLPLLNYKFYVELISYLKLLIFLSFIFLAK